MRGVKSWGLTAALIVGLGGAVGTAEASDDDGKTPAPKGLLSGLFAGKAKPQDKAALKPDEANPEPPNVADNTTLQRHKNALMRRMEVCDRLREVALDTGNEALMAQADQLENRAQEIFRQQTAGLPVSSPLAASRPTIQAKEVSQTGGMKNKDADGKVSPLPRTPRALGAASLDGNMERREQAILNGSSMEGIKP